MDEQTVLILGPDAGADELESALPTNQATVDVRPLSALADLFDVLTNDVVHCLVLPPVVEETDAERIVRGVRGLFPDLPIVLAGTPAEPLGENLDITIVDAATPADDGVVAAVRSALDAGVESDASRPPSRMETLLLSMLDQFPVHLYAKDGEARHVITSSTNQSSTALIGLTDLEYTELPEAHREAAHRDDLKVIEGNGTRIEVEEYTDFIDSHTLTTKVPWFDEHDSVVGLVGLTRDITERKKREQAARRQHELLVKVALVAAHELRNELQVAAGRLELLEADADHLAVIADSQARLASIIDKIVELASEERPAREDEAQWLSTICREVWATLEVTDATLSIVEDCHFVADRESMRLFFQILFKNVLQHGGPNVTVSVGSTDDGLFVADDGPGIAVDPPERIFDAGYSSDPDGTGFGLYVARSIADEHGWRLEVCESDAGGTRFDVHGPSLEDDATIE